MPIEAPLDDFDPNSDFDSPAPGNYHGYACKLQEAKGRNGELIVDYEVLAGSVPGQESKIYRDYFSVTTKAMGRIHKLAIALGMITVAQLDDLKKRGAIPSYNFEAENGKSRQLFFALNEEEYQGKKKIKAGFNLYHPNDPKVASWPRNEAFLKAGGYEAKPATAPSPAPAKAMDDDILAGV